MYFTDVKDENVMARRRIASLVGEQQQSIDIADSDLDKG